MSVIGALFGYASWKDDEQAGSYRFVGRIRTENALVLIEKFSTSGSWKLDVSSGTVTVSPQIFRIFGVKPDEDTSTVEFWLSRNHLEDQKRIQELFERSMVQKTHYDADYRIVLPDGTIKHLHAVGHPVLNESGDLVEFVGTAMDITEQHEANGSATQRSFPGPGTDPQPHGQLRLERSQRRNLLVGGDLQHLSIRSSGEAYVGVGIPAHSS